MSLSKAAEHFASALLPPVLIASIGRATFTKSGRATFTKSTNPTIEDESICVRPDPSTLFFGAIVDAVGAQGRSCCVKASRT